VGERIRVTSFPKAQKRAKWSFHVSFAFYIVFVLPDELAFQSFGFSFAKEESSFAIRLSSSLQIERPISFFFSIYLYFFHSNSSKFWEALKHGNRAFN